MSHVPLPSVVCVALVLCLASAKAASATLLVPTNYATIQAAIDAAAPGDTVQVLGGIYIEQLRVQKDVAIVGAGMDATVVRAPYMLRRGALKETAIVEIFNGAKVAISKLTVGGPGQGTCKRGALKAGIRVHGNAHLDFNGGAVRDIQDTPLAPCFRSGTGILVGEQESLAVMQVAMFRAWVLPL